MALAELCPQPGPMQPPCAAIQQLGGKQAGGRLGSLARAWGAKGSVGEAALVAPLQCNGLSLRS